MTVQAAPNWVPTPPPVDSFAGRLRLLRLALEDISAEEMARRIDVEPRNYRNWEAGRLPRDLSAVARKINGATGVSLRWLLLGDDTPPDQEQRTPWCESPLATVSHIGDRRPQEDTLLTAVGF